MVNAGSAGEQGELVYVAVGSNLGDREKAFVGALESLVADPDLCLLRVSRVFETPPVGPVGQGAYLNAVIELRVALGPFELLERLHRIERAMGRDRSQEAERWGPRSLDLDILFFGERQIESSELVIPHPRSHERNFVMVPMAEIAPKLRHPTLEKSMAEIARSLDGLRGPYDWSDPSRWPS
jgi:2-amino-4-hydroxy-6-hydroxymethyldihydropteridine diphosphokinase